MSQRIRWWITDIAKVSTDALELEEIVQSKIYSTTSQGYVFVLIDRSCTVVCSFGVDHIRNPTNWLTEERTGIILIDLHMMVINLWGQSIGHSLQWRHDECDDVSNHQPHDCLLQPFNHAPIERKQPSSASLAFVTRHWPCEENSPVAGKFPSPRASNGENVSIWWCHHVLWRHWNSPLTDLSTGSPQCRPCSWRWRRRPSPWPPGPLRGTYRTHRTGSTTVDPHHDWEVTVTEQWHHNEHDGVSYHQPHDWLLNRLFRHGSKNTTKLRVTGLCGGIHRWPVNSVPAQRPSNAADVSIWWRHHGVSARETELQFVSNGVTSFLH